MVDENLQDDLVLLCVSHTAAVVCATLHTVMDTDRGTGTDRQTHRHTDTHTHTHTHTQKERNGGGGGERRQTDRQTDRLTISPGGATVAMLRVVSVVSV